MHGRRHRDIHGREIFPLFAPAAIFIHAAVVAAAAGAVEAALRAEAHLPCSPVLFMRGAVIGRLVGLDLGWRRTDRLNRRPANARGIVGIVPLPEVQRGRREVGHRGGGGKQGHDLCSRGVLRHKLHSFMRGGGGGGGGCSGGGRDVKRGWGWASGGC